MTDEHIAAIKLLRDAGYAVAVWTPEEVGDVELFQQCLAQAPAGPATTKYNDWEEVIETCHRTAYGDAEAMFS